MVPRQPQPSRPPRSSLPPQAHLPVNLATATLTGSSGGWHEQQQALSFQPPPPLRRPAAADHLPLASPRSPLQPAIPEQQELPGSSADMMLHGDAAGGAGSVSSSSHDSLGELAAAQAVVGAAPAAEPELSELEQRKVVVLG